MCNRIFQARAWRGLTQQELAARAGVSRSTICALERTGAYPSIRICVRLCRALDCAFEEVFPIDVLM